MGQTIACALCGGQLTINGWPQNRLKYHAECARIADRQRKRERLAAQGRPVRAAVEDPPRWHAY